MPVSCETAVKAHPPPLMPPRSEISSPKRWTTISIDGEPINALNHTMPRHARWYSVLELVNCCAKEIGNPMIPISQLSIQLFLSLFVGVVMDDIQEIYEEETRRTHRRKEDQGTRKLPKICDRYHGFVYNTSCATAQDCKQGWPFQVEPGVQIGRSSQYNHKITPLIWLLSPLLFFAPDTHCIVLHELYNDGITPPGWSAFIRKLSTEWQDFVINVRINATVLLNANIAFLAIQSIDQSSVDKGCSPAQIASYVSTILSVGSISLGLLLLQKYCHKNRVHDSWAWNFLGIQKEDLGRKLGLETLAIMFSLPWALLMWALSVRMIVGSALLAISILIFWYLTISQEQYKLRCPLRGGWYKQYCNILWAWDRVVHETPSFDTPQFWTSKKPQYYGFGVISPSPEEPKSENPDDVRASLVIYSLIDPVRQYLLRLT
ncbi:hypothetical protein IW262DRAFT_1300797 [Armillaria fumosa]|nr:hypothetical protein IW262DRAFT_1300797 [Armillaria fumosa]